MSRSTPAIAVTLAVAILAACGASMNSTPNSTPNPTREPSEQPSGQAGAPPGQTGTTSCQEGLFTAVEGVTIDVRKDPALLRQRAVRVDFARMEASPERLVLNLFANVCLTAVRDRKASPNPDQWTGVIEGVPNSVVTIVTTGRTAIGSIISPPRAFQIRLLRDDIHLINEVDPSKYPKEK
jgi:hypothetical protein